MRWFTLLLLFLFAGVAACSKSSSDESTASAQAAATVQTEFNVEGMHCATCPVTVKAAAEGVRGVRSVRVSMDDAKAWVTYDPTQATPGAIAAAITESGYRATAVGVQ